MDCSFSKYIEYGTTTPDTRFVEFKNCPTYFSKTINFIADKIYHLMNGEDPTEALLNFMKVDLVGRCIVQKVALPAVASILPGRLGNVFNHPVTRVVLTTALLTLAKQNLSSISAYSIAGSLALSALLEACANLT